MRRRGFLGALFGAPNASASDRKVPLEFADAHRFVGAWNRFAEKLFAGEIPIEEWRAVERAWDRMTGDRCPSK